MYKLILSDIGFVAADTTRSKIYLQALLMSKMKPAHVFLLFSGEEKSFPGQYVKETDERRPELNPIIKGLGQFDLVKPINETLLENRISFTALHGNDINSTENVQIVEQAKESVMIYSGFGGVILGKAILNCGKRFLHVHGGYLPHFPGSTTNYYSLITNGTMGATSMFLSEQIDCGPTLVGKTFKPPKNCLEIDHVYDSAMRAEVLVETLKGYQDTGCFPASEQSSKHRNYFVIHPILKHIAIMTNYGSDI